MLRITFISDAAVSTKLCESTRSLAEHNLQWGQTRVLQLEELAFAEFQSGINRDNKRNRLSFDVSRSQDFAGTEFTTAEKAFAFAIAHVNGAGGAAGADVLGGSGTLKIELTGETTLYMHNALLEQVSLTTGLGICVGLNYSFNGGVINTTA